MLDGAASELIVRGLGIAFLAATACAAEEPTRWLIVEERVELCGAAPGDWTPFDRVASTQWRVGIEAGEYALPDPQPLPDRPPIFAAEGSLLPSLLDVRDVENANPVTSPLEGAVLQHANLFYRADDALDVLLMWTDVDSPFAGSLTFALDTATGEDFRLETLPEVTLSCPLDLGPCPGRWFIACDPGGPTMRTRVTLDRGEIVLDVRWVDGMVLDGEPNHVMFVASELRIDDVELAQHDFHRLLHSSASFSIVGDGSYAVLAPEVLEPAGLGCGIAVTGVGTEAPRAFTVDCELREAEALGILDVGREVLDAA